MNETQKKQQTVERQTDGLHLLELTYLEYKTIREVFEKQKWTLKRIKWRKLTKYDETDVERNQQNS